jgi:hypothetical protein
MRRGIVAVICISCMLGQTFDRKVDINEIRWREILTDVLHEEKSPASAAATVIGDGGCIRPGSFVQYAHCHLLHGQVQSRPPRLIVGASLTIFDMLGTWKESQVTVSWHGRAGDGKAPAPAGQ